MPLLLLLAGLPSAHAFCGTYVGPVGSALENQASQVVLARNGDETVLTLASDVVGDVADFALVIPVPEVLTVDDVTLADPELFAALDAYSAPRIVSYTCDDLYGGGDDSADSASEGGGGSADGVVVEEQFTVGAYEIFVLSADGAEGLLGWLDDNGFALPAAAAPVVQEYIDAGQFFLAARVSLESEPSAPGYLEPLRFRYTSSMWTLPIRIGTTVSPGAQDLVVYALASQRVAIANYPEATIESDCMVPEGTSDYGAFYQQQLLDAFSTGIWFTEYAWSPKWCDPCSGEPPDPATLEEAGGSSAGTITRLRLRYTPEQATQDLVLYETFDGYTQVKYIEYAYELESDFLTCGVGRPDDPGSCPDGGDSGDSGEGGNGGEDDTGTTGKGDGGCGCGTANGAGAVSLGLALLALAHRRR